MLVPRWVCRAMMVLGAIGLLEAVAGMLVEDPFRWRSLTWLLAFVGPLYAVGVLAYVRRPDLPIARIVLLVGGLWAAPGPYLVYLIRGADPALWGVFLGTGLLGLAAMAATATLVAVYPDGRYQRGYEHMFVRGGWLLATLTAVTLLVSSPVIPVDLEHVEASVPNPVRIAALAGAEPVADILATGVSLLPAAAVGLLVLRYRRCGLRARRQIRWLLLVPIAILATVLVTLIADLVGIEADWFDWAGTVAEYVLLALIPLALWLSILRHQLLDVDVVIRKSVVYAVLWILIATAYLGVAAAIGVASSQLLPVTMVVLLTIVVTLGFQPARRALERLADRWVFGRRLEGYVLLGHLGEQLESTVDQNQVLAALAEAVRTGLRLEWARVVLYLRWDGETGREIVALAGHAAGPPDRQVTLTHGDDPLGVIDCGPKFDGAFSDEDGQVLDTLARQAALALNNARLTAELSARLDDIKRQAAELAASRARIVQAADVERRRIERDLHDGAQQQLVALMAGLQLARNQLRREPDRADATLAELQAEATSLYGDILELTRGIHPPVLTDRGLAEALQSRADRLPLDVSVVVPPELRTARFADDIEGAAYFVVSEALTNVLKHAGASRALVRLASRHGELRLTVTDDGMGFNDATRPGNGLTNMTDRLEALGGGLALTSTPGDGCTVEVRLPARARGGADD